MASVNKLLVQGIRSFNPTDGEGQMIRFYSPMTLIVGENGCGKTTLIESLKYAITGQLPPNTKNGGFVSDPKLGGSCEVKAAVKLTMLDRAKQKVVIIRKLKSETKGKQGKTSTTTIEGTVSHQIPLRNGEMKKVELSSKCIDIQEIINGIIGVSEPILNNVVFCHQEDSCWPLDEASKVKTKFDAIFNTTVYIKAMATLQKKEKTIGSDFKCAKLSYEHATSILEEVQKKRVALETRNVELSEIKNKFQEYDAEMSESVSKLSKLETLQCQLHEKQNVVFLKRGQIEGLGKIIKEIKSKITERFEGSLSSLNEKIEQFQFLFAQKEIALKDICRSKSSAENELRALIEKTTQFRIKTELFEQKLQQNAEREQEMSKLMDDLCLFIRTVKDNSQTGSFSMSLDSVLTSFEADPSSVQPTTAIKALNAAILMKENEHEQLKVKLAGEENNIRKELDEHRKMETEITTALSIKQKTETEMKSKIETLQRRLDELEASDDTLLVLAIQEKEILGKIETLEKSEFILKLRNEIQELENDITTLGSKLEEMQRQSTLLCKDSEYIQQIKAAKEIKRKKREECDRLIKNIDPRLRTLLTDTEEMPSGLLYPFIEKKVSTLTAEFGAKTKGHTQKKMEIVKMETQREGLVSQLEKKTKELKTIQQKARGILNGNTFEDEYQKAAEETDEAQNEVSMSGAASILYKKYVQNMNKKPCCPLCKRDFNRKEENDTLIEQLTKTMRNMELTKPSQESKLLELKTKQEQLLQFKPDWERKIQLEQELIELKKKKADLDSQLQSKNLEVEDLADTVSLLHGDKTTAESLLNECSLYDKAREEEGCAKQKIIKAENARDPAAKELTMTIDEVTFEQSNLQSTLRSKTSEKQRKEALCNTKSNELNSAKSSHNKIVQKKLELTANLQNREGTEKQKDELESELGAVRLSIQQFRKQIPTIRRDIDQTQKKIKEALKQHEMALSSITTEKSNLTSKKIRVAELQNQIEKFGLESVQYEDEANKRQECKANLELCQAKIRQLNTEISVLENEVASQRAVKSNLDMNRMLKQNEQECAALQEDIKDDMTALDEAKFRGIASQIAEMKANENKISEKLGRARGSMNVIKEDVMKLQAELKSPKFSNAEADYQKHLIKKFVLEKAQRDIRLYRLALDSAVMTFHRKKMETINKYLKFYWKKIYKGNDIDFIEIKTDIGEGSTAIIDMSKIQRKNYSYRVVMNRRGTELDMRGRCSAGQKVLASIIIRLALAQTFTTNCGIITLDEPTTNLDVKNILSLAETLSDLAGSMKNQSSFQLIVITHDQAFIDLLRKIDSETTYYKLSRDMMGFSKIEEKVNTG